MSFINSISKEEVYKAVQKFGPITPIGIRRKIGEGDSITIGAALSELVRSGNVNYTSVRKGSSPFYYTNNQKKKLEDFISFLNEKDMRACKKLRDSKVLEDAKQTSLIRVSLRNIPDYSKKLVANIQGEKKVFWRYYLVDESEAISIIKNMLNKPRQTKQTSSLPKEREPPKSEVEKPKEKEREEKQDTLNEYDFDDEFFTLINKYFKNNNINIKEAEQVRKNRDYEFIIKVPTPVGSLSFYCRCRKKKKLSKGDVSRAYIQGLKRQMPTLILTTGKLGKKTRKELNTEFKGLVVKEDLT